MTSPSASSSHASTNEIGSPPGAIQPTERESPVPEEVSTGSEQHEQSEAELDDKQNTRAEVESRDSKGRLRHQQEADAEVTSRDTKGRLHQKENRLIAKRKRAYLGLFDKICTDADAGAGLPGKHGYGHESTRPLGDSRIAGSIWTRDEKERFFTELARRGGDNLPAIARGIGTKSELEVRLYLLALGAAVDNEAESSGAPKDFSRADVPAAHEVSAECEEASDAAASALSADHQRQDKEAERKKFEDAWLVDAEAAAAIDTLIDHQSSSESGAESASEGLEDAAEQAVRKGLLTSSTAFFDATMLLQLSRNLFMNGPPEGYWNYRTADVLILRLPSSGSDSASDVEGTDDHAPIVPAIYRSALNDFHALVKTVTQKLVHATLFQATSRLRAKDDSSPAPTILASDVHVAADVLGLNLDWKAYWAKLPRRAGLDVYSESDKYKRGRMGTKNGVKLTYDEVEAELGLPKLTESLGRKRDVGASSLQPDAMNGDSSSTEFDSDADDSEVSSDGVIELQHERERRKRRRGLSPESFARAEERYLRAFDQRADKEENARLRDLLGLDVTVAAGEEVEDMPGRPKLKKSRREERWDWRENVEETAAWEVEYMRRLGAGREESESEEDVDAGSGEESERSDPEDGNALPDDESDAGSRESGPRRTDDEMDGL